MVRWNRGAHRSIFPESKFLLDRNGHRNRIYAGRKDKAGLGSQPKKYSKEITGFFARNSVPLCFPEKQNIIR